MSRRSSIEDYVKHSTKLRIFEKSTAQLTREQSRKEKCLHYSNSNSIQNNKGDSYSRRTAHCYDCAYDVGVANVLF